MATKTPQQKKEDILTFLNDRAGDDHLIVFEKRRIISRFTDETYDAEMIEGFIDDLLSDGVLVERKTKLEIVYPSIQEDSFRERFGNLIEERTIFNVYLWGTVLYLLFLNWYPIGDVNIFYELLFGDISGLRVESVNRATIFGIVGAYTSGKIWPCLDA